MHLCTFDTRTTNTDRASTFTTSYRVERLYTLQWNTSYVSLPAQEQIV